MQLSRFFYNMVKQGRKSLLLLTLFLLTIGGTYSDEYEDEFEEEPLEEIKEEVEKQEEYFIEFSEITSSESDLAACISLDGKFIVFQSNRDDINRYSLYQTFWSQNRWEKPQRIILDGSATFEGLPYFATRGGAIFYTAISKNNYRNSNDINIAADIWMVSNENNRWGAPKHLAQPINTKFEEITPWVSFDGRFLFFASNREGGFGGFDIWVSEFNGETWLAPQNLGAEINTAGNEIYPRLQPDGKMLYYSSDKTGGIGGYDIFIARKFGLEWKEGINAGPRINSKVNDFVNSFPANGDYMIVSRGKNGEEKIYKLKPIPAELKFNPQFLVNIQVTAGDSLQELPFQLELKDEVSNKVVFQKNYEPVAIKQTQEVSEKGDQPIKKYFSQKGLFVTIPAGKYNVLITADGYLFTEDNFEITGQIHINSNNEILKKYTLQKIAVGSVARLSSIYFEGDKAELTEESKVNLFRLARFMAKNPGIWVEIGGHTAKPLDTSANAKTNAIKLSLERAKAVADILHHYGIDKNRLKIKGYGDSQPVSQQTGEEGRALNRRVEFKILDLKQLKE